MDVDTVMFDEHRLGHVISLVLDQVVLEGCR
jgi:hypothetical protein